MTYIEELGADKFIMPPALKGSILRIFGNGGCSTLAVLDPMVVSLAFISRELEQFADRVLKNKFQGINLTAKSKTLLEINDLSITYNSVSPPIKAVNNVSFELRKGENLGIIGESGCGKSTTALGIMGLIKMVLLKEASSIRISIWLVSLMTK